MVEPTHLQADDGAVGLRVAIEELRVGQLEAGGQVPNASGDLEAEVDRVVDDVLDMDQLPIREGQAGRGRQLVKLASADVERRGLGRTDSLDQHGTEVGHDRRIVAQVTQFDLHTLGSLTRLSLLRHHVDQRQDETLHVEPPGEDNSV